MCAGSTLPSAASTADLACFLGFHSTAGNSSIIAPSMVTSAAGYVPANFKMCFAATGRMNGKLTRAYYGAGSIEQASNLVNSVLTNVTDFFACTTQKCNSPAADACATAGGTLSALTSPVCGAPESPPPAANAIACYTNLNATSPILQTTPVSLLCVALTHRCQGAGDPIPTCNGKAAGAVVRVYGDSNTLSDAFGGAAFRKDAGDFYGGALTSADYFIRSAMDALFLCNSAGW
jgi:hypothetical protein